MTNNDMIIAIDTMEKVANKYIEFYKGKISYDQFSDFALKTYDPETNPFAHDWLEANYECRMINSSGGLFSSITDGEFLYDNDASQYVFDYWKRKIGPIVAYSRKCKSIENN